MKAPGTWSGRIDKSQRDCSSAPELRNRKAWTGPDRRNRERDLAALDADERRAVTLVLEGNLAVLTPRAEAFLRRHHDWLSDDELLKMAAERVVRRTVEESKK